MLGKDSKHVVRKYDPEYIKSGFIRAGSDAELKVKCVECGGILLNETLKLLKLQRHLKTKHLRNVGKTRIFSKEKGQPSGPRASHPNINNQVKSHFEN